MFLLFGGLEESVINEGTDDGWGTRTNRSSERFREDLSLFHLRAIDLRTNHGAEGDFGAELLRDGEGQGGFSGSWGTDEKKGTPRKFTRLDKVHNDATGLGEDPDDWFSSRTGWARD